MTTFNPKHKNCFHQYGEARGEEAGRHLASITQYNSLLTKKRKVLFSTPKKGGGSSDTEKVSHPTDVAPNLLNKTNLEYKHLGCMIKKVSEEQLPFRPLKPGVITAIHHISASLPVALSTVFPNHATETYRKLFLYALHFAMMAISKGSLKITQTDYFDPPDEEPEEGKEHSPESVASVRGVTEDSSDQAGNRASDVCFESRSIVSQSFLPAFLTEEKGDNKSLPACTPQWTGYSAPKLVQLVNAPVEETRALDLAGCITSSKEWMGLLARPLAWLLDVPGGVKLDALKKAPERLKEAEEYVDKLAARVSAAKTLFPNVQYQGPFLVFEVLVGPVCQFLGFPLDRLSPNHGTYNYLRYFLSSCFKQRVSDWTPDMVYKLYGAAWASQHLRSALLTYASVEKAGEWANKELTMEGLRELLPAEVLARLLVDPMQSYRAELVPPLQTATALPASAAAPWWESSTFNAFAKGMAAAWMSSSGDEGLSKVQRTALKHVLSAHLEDDPDIQEDAGNEQALQVLQAVKWLYKKNRKGQAKEVLKLLLEAEFEA